MADNVTKVTVNLPDETVAAVREIAKERGVTNTEAIRQAIESERFLREKISDGNEVLLEGPDKSISRVIFR